MSGYIDLHCHWVAGVDDGAPTSRHSADLLRALQDVGYSAVIATPHMRTGMFDNTREELQQAYAKTVRAIENDFELPEIGLASEHHLDDIVFQRLMSGDALPYPSGQAALIEFPYERFPVAHTQRLFDLRCHQIRPVLAHPERYQPVCDDINTLEPILDGGTVLLLDVGALAGKYGRASKKCAEKLLERGFYYAACSDAHRAADAKPVAKGIQRLYTLMGQEEADFMMIEGPRNILNGTIQD